MAITVGPSLATGPIRWSTLREEFLAKQPRTSYSGSETIDEELNDSPISATQLLRDTDKTSKNPIVPDCKENRDAGISASNNLKASQFRNSIKFYYIQQTGTNDNSSDTSQPGLTIDLESWNTNLGDNVVKKIFIDGTVGSTVVSQPALKLINVTTNLELTISGNVYAAGGLGGVKPGNSSSLGQNGGNAIEISSPNNSNVTINVLPGSKVYAGGGGGERGNAGAPGGGGSCRATWSHSQCGGHISCPGGYYTTSSHTGGCCRRRCSCIFCWCTRCIGRDKSRSCARDYSISGGYGGAGGAGGTGRGYNNLTGTIAGSGGGAGGGAGSCGGDQTTSWASAGKTGGTGAAAGDWNGIGSVINSSTTATVPGKAIVGSSYSVKGSVSTAIKGSYKPS